MLVIGGGVAMIAAIVIASTASSRVRYRPRRLTRADVVVMAGVFTAPALLVALDVAGDDSLAWFASPLRWPELHVLPAAHPARAAHSVRVAAPSCLDGRRRQRRTRIVQTRAGRWES